MQPKAYPSDLTRTQWKRLKRLLPAAKPGGRPRSVNLRNVLNGIFYILRGGCAWRMMPHDFPPWSTCYDYFRKWRNNGTWAKINDALRTRVRRRAGREKSPSMGIIDSQSVKTTERGGRTARMRSRRSTAASGTWWSTRWAWSWRPWSIRRASRIGTVPSWC
jgi:putative transposase